jgi:hypothetical protein
VYAKRTPGTFHDRVNCGGIYRLYLQADGKTIADYRYKNGYSDLAFAAAGPDMMAVISALEAKLKTAQRALTLAVHTIEPFCCPKSPIRRLTLPHMRRRQWILCALASPRHHKHQYFRLSVRVRREAGCPFANGDGRRD